MYYHIDTVLRFLTFDGPAKSPYYGMRFLRRLRPPVQLPRQLMRPPITLIVVEGGGR